jgi:hypothetical protein
MLNRQRSGILPRGSSRRGEEDRAVFHRTNMPEKIYWY